MGGNMLLSRDEATIIAQCTPKGSGALALLRLSGINTLDIAGKMSTLASGKKLIDVPTHTIQYGSVVDQKGTAIDQVLFLVMHGPKTFTGQDTVEISCHNNPFIIEAITAAALKSGARLAQEGEFTKRAVLNKKMDLIQAEAINDLIHANNQQTLKQSLAQLNGTLSAWIHQIEKQLIKAIALSEASFEFIDEEDMAFGTQIEKILAGIMDDIEKIKESFDQQNQIRNGIRIALIGSVNAGKSSLFNALLGKDRAIVTEQPGTTRDVIESGLYRNGTYLTMVDTAGLRQTEDKIEKEGIKRSEQEAQKADIILLIIDGSRENSKEEQAIYHELHTTHRHKTIVIKNKADIAKDVDIVPDAISASYKQPKSIETINQAIERMINRLFTTIASPLLLNQRQFNLLLQLEQKLIEIFPLLKGTIQYELLSYHLSDAVAHIAELTGKTISEESMNAVFREFCVGK
ncbi:tRNA uridine-5-carboxymethylaminomethyl(34) synthesis GTPase MnmE [Candidatus Dependentiae bacterium]|nr:MAG: tRNA uridine-5-carboxymethylaminomethyl(34) synthesis GTPase MnmE [Candidatus Dependentiae bacterium]